MNLLDWVRGRDSHPKEWTSQRVIGTRQLGMRHLRRGEGFESHWIAVRVHERHSGRGEGFKSHRILVRGHERHPERGEGLESRLKIQRG